MGFNDEYYKFNNSYYYIRQEAPSIQSNRFRMIGETPVVFKLKKSSQNLPSRDLLKRLGIIK